jgi:ComF family protein
MHDGLIRSFPVGLTTAARRLGWAAAQLLWPARCAACDGLVPASAAFCSPCEASLLVADPACPRCALPVDLLAGGVQNGCAACAGSDWAFDRAVAALVYGGSIADAIIGLKHGGRRHAARSLAVFVVPMLASAAADGVDAIVPVPLHPRKLRTRGFNQALVIARYARAMAGRRVPPILPDALVRTRDTVELGRAGPRERRDRVDGAFAVRKPAVIDGRYVLVLDDVMTTGATVSACASALRAAGARKVTVAALARAP